MAPSTLVTRFQVTYKENIAHSKASKQKGDWTFEGYEHIKGFATMVLKRAPMLFKRLFFQKHYTLFSILIFTFMVNTMVSAQDLTLYVLPHCPYCHKVERYIDENHIQGIDKKNIENPTYKEELISIGGKKQVPCLVHDNQALYESNDIIEWLKVNAIKA